MDQVKEALKQLEIAARELRQGLDNVNESNVVEANQAADELCNLANGIMKRLAVESLTVGR